LTWKEIDLNERHHWINAFQQTFLIWGLLTVLYPKSPHGSQRNDDSNKKENNFFTLKFFWVLSRMVKLTEKMIRMTRMTYSARKEGLTTFFFIHRLTISLLLSIPWPFQSPTWYQFQNTFCSHVTDTATT
jgi:hypothetical protein